MPKQWSNCKLTTLNQVEWVAESWIKDGPSSTYFQLTKSEKFRTVPVVSFILGTERYLKRFSSALTFEMCNVLMVKSNCDTQVNVFSVSKQKLIELCQPVVSVNILTSTEDKNSTLITTSVVLSSHQISTDIWVDLTNVD